VNPNLLTFSTATVGDVPAATYSFASSGYQTPRQGRSIGMDVVHNQNGIFKYVYDQGPGIYSWDPFELVFDDDLTDLGSATVQWENFLNIWNHQGGMGFRAPESTYQVHFSSQELQRRFQRFPASVGDKMEFRVTIQLEEG
jgi:hypothetical protein